MNETLSQQNPRSQNILSFDLDVFGQQPDLGIFTQLCLCYPVIDTITDSTIIHTLKSGLERLSASFPWVAGQVVRDDPIDGSAGVFKIREYKNIPEFIVKDLRNDSSFPSMDTIRQSKFPFRILDEGVICPRKTLPGSPDAFTPYNPVFFIQANFIRGGLLLTFISSHQAMDMTGMGQIMHLLSTACHNEPFASEELTIGNLFRPSVIPLLDDSYELGPELYRQIPKPLQSKPSSPAPPLPSTWAYFDFSPDSLAALKEIATKSLQSGFVSTDDTLTAFIWQSIMRARLFRLNPTIETTMARAVDPRRHLDIPSTYTGLVQNMTYHTRSIQELLDQPLGTIAADLRAAVDPRTSRLAFNTRALATAIDRSVDKKGVSVTATLDLSSDLMLSSWAKVNSYELDFNLGLGNPESVRRPQFYPLASLLYLMPKAPDGRIAAALCLTDDDMKSLKEDTEFLKYAEYIG
jgi:hypothetical protein